MLPVVALALFVQLLGVASPVAAGIAIAVIGIEEPYLLASTATAAAAPCTIRFRLDCRACHC